jgi:hypothetical protein
MAARRRTDGVGSARTQDATQRICTKEFVSSEEDQKSAVKRATYTVRKAPSVQEQPSADLAFWRVIQDGIGLRHLFGYLPETTRCRMTTAIVEIDVVQRRWVTASGRVYRTHGEPGLEIEEDMLVRLASHHHLPGPTEDVTDPIWQAMQSAVH